MDLYVVRHAIAAERDSTRWPDDGLRPLTPEGERRFRQAARGLRRFVPSVDVVLASPYARAWRTAEILQEEAGWPPPKKCEALEAERSPAEGVEALLPYRSAESVAVVGHEPNLSELCSILLSGRPDTVSIQMKKGAVACLWMDAGARPGAAVLRWLLTPKVLRAVRP
jgi:phosphohistidine phosphatase